MNKFLLLLIFFFLSFIKLYGQGINNNWLMGYANWAGPPWGGIDINFNTGIPIINYVSRDMSFKSTNSNISNNFGNILFYSNGYYIANALGDTMQNGSGLNPSQYTSQYPDGLNIPQANLIIPKPGSSNLYYLFHSTIDNTPVSSTANYLYLTIIDMDQNNGLGEVVSKNVIVINDTLCPGQITACKHANGRDWWIICHRVFSNKYYKLLITPYQILGPFIQNIGIDRTPFAAQIVFSNDGKKLASYSRDRHLDLFNFDRCTGLLSDSVHIVPDSSASLSGVSFSSNSEILYVSTGLRVFQYDLTVSNIANSEIIVAVWDSFYSPNPPFATMFHLSQLAPDGKIYLSTGNGTQHLHVINQPNNLGISCDLIQHGISLPAFYNNTLPNHPNYFLGADSGSVCDTIVTTVNIFEPPEIKIKTFPNPNNGIFTLGFPAQKEQGVLEIYDVLGNLILKENVAQWSQFKRVNIENVNSGIYLCKISWGEKSANVKVMKE